MKQRILVPLDGSEHAERVYPWLTFLQKMLHPDSEIILFRAFEPPSQIYLLPELSVPSLNSFSDSYLSEKFFDYLTEQKLKLNIPNLDIELTIGDPATEILDRAPTFDLILMASHGRGGLGRWLLGSVATKVVRASGTPVMLVGGNVPFDEPNEKKKIQTIFVPVDGSESSERAYGLAMKYSEQWDTEVSLYLGVPHLQRGKRVATESNQRELAIAKKYLNGLVARYENVATSVQCRSTFGESGILAAAEEKRADLIIMGASGKSAVQRWMLGSETEHVLRQAKCPVVVVH